MKLEGRDFRNSIWLAAQYLVLIGFSFLGLKLNLLSFGKEAFGVWVLLLSVFGLGGAIDFGIGVSVVRLVAANGKSTQLDSDFTNALAYVLVFGALLAVSLVFILQGFVITNGSLVSASQVDTFASVSIVLAFGFYLNYIANIFRGVFEGLNRFKWVAKLSILNTAVQFSGIVFVYLLRLDILALASLYAFGAALLLAAHLYLFFGSQSNVRIAPRALDSRVAIRMLGQSLTLQGVNILGTSLDPIIKYIIGICAGPSQIATYEISRRFVTALSGIYTSSLRNVLPKVSALASVHEYQGFLENSAIPITRIAVYFSMLGLSLLSPAFLCLSERFYKTSDAILVFLILVMVESTNNFGNVFYAFIIGLRREKLLLGIQFLNVLFVISFLKFGYRYFGNALGLIGFYFSVLICSLLILFCVSSMAEFPFSRLWEKSRWKLLFGFHCLTCANMWLTAKNPESSFLIQVLYFAVCLPILGNSDCKSMYRKIKVAFKSAIQDSH